MTELTELINDLLCFETNETSDMNKGTVFPSFFNAAAAPLVFFGPASLCDPSVCEHLQSQKH